MSTRQQLLVQLADGRFHSGTALGNRLGISRAAVNKSIQGLIERGLDIHSVSGKGYRWVSPAAPLSGEYIRTKLDQFLAGHNLAVTVLDEVESTSSYLLGKLTQAYVGPEVCLAEHQTGGRGRRGRQWQSSPYQNITLSISWRYDAGPSRLSGLSIAAGVAIMRALQTAGIKGAKLKWPNDVLHDNRKLAGVLVDLRGESEGPTSIVLGVGLNVRLHPVESAKVDQDWTDLVSIHDRPTDRNELAALLILELYKMLTDFAQQGLRPYFDEWEKWHAYENQPVRLIQSGSEIEGTVCGIDDNGALHLDTGNAVIKIHSGEVSLRAS